MKILLNQSCHSLNSSESSLIRTNYVKQIILLVTFMVLSPVFLNATFPPTECPDCDLVYPHDPENGFFNPDSVLVDTTNNTDYYARGSFYVIFNVMPIDISGLETDTLYVFGESDLDTTKPEVIAFFDSLKQTFGDFKLYKQVFTQTDSTMSEYFFFVLTFDNWLNINLVLNTLSSDSLVDFSNYCDLTSDKKDSEEFQSGEDEFVIHENYRGNIHLKQTRHLAAFEITKGSPDVFIGLQQEWGHNANISNPQAYPDENQYIGYSYLHSKYEPGYGIGDGYLQNNYEGKDYSNYFGTLFHKMVTCTSSNWTENNTYAMPGTEQGNVLFATGKRKQNYMANTLISSAYEHDIRIATIVLNYDNGKGKLIGSCPNCFGIAYHRSWPSDMVDCNPTKEGFQMPNVVNRSKATNSIDFKIIERSLLNGTCYVTDGAWGIVNGVGYQNSIKAISPKAYAFFNNTLNLNNDNTIYSPWDYRLQVEEGIKTYFVNGFQFYDNYSLSDLHGKFQGNSEIPIEDGVKREDTETYDILSPQPAVDAKNHPVPDVLQNSKPGYYIPNGLNDGNGMNRSWAIPVVSGVVGLMLSIDSLLGINVQTQPRYNIPNKAYDIITFTATKPYYNGSYIDLSGGNYNDPLKRYFSYAFTFGVVNTLRAVTHSFRNKAPHTISTDLSNHFKRMLNGSSRGCLNGENQELLHFGAYNSEGIEVLKEGGNHYVANYGVSGFVPNEAIPAYDNSHGTTIINSNLNVAKSSSESYGALLSIDGILKNGSGSQMSITNDNTVYDNKLIITGFMEGVKIKGNNIVTDNIHVFSKNENVSGEFEFTGGASKAYGTIYLHKDCKLTVKDGGIFTMETSSAVYLYNDSEIIIGDGGEMIIDYSTVIRSPKDDLGGNSNGKITVKPGGKLTIKEGGLTHIDVPIILESESDTKFGTLELGTDNLTHLYEVELQGYSQIIMNNKSNLHIKKNIIANGNSSIKMIGQSSIRHYNYHPAPSEPFEIFGELITLNDESSLIVDEEGLAYIDVPIIVNSTSSSNDIGVLFKDQSTTFIQKMHLEGSGKSKLFTNSKVHVKDSIVINGANATLTFDENSAVLHYDMNEFTVDGLWKPLGIYINDKFDHNEYHNVLPANGMIIVGSGARLEVPSTTVSLLSGVYVRENGTLNVVSEADLNLGQFVNVGTFNINLGSNIDLFCNSNYVFNNFNLFSEVSPSNRIKFNGFLGEFNFFPSEKPDKVIVCIPRIFVTDFNAEDETEVNRKFYRADFKVEHVDFNTVFWQISKGDKVEFDDCNFQMDSKELFDDNTFYTYEGGKKHKYGLSVPPFINISKDRVSIIFDNHPLRKHNIKNASVTNCSFIETGYNDGDISSPPNSLKYGSYHFQPYFDFKDTLNYDPDKVVSEEEKLFRKIPISVYIQNDLGISNVNNNTFDKVMIALWCEDVRHIEENQNDIDNTYRGVKLISTSSNSCSNNLSNVKYAYEIHHGNMTFYNNILSNSLVGTRIESGISNLNHNQIFGAKFGTHLLKGGYATIGKEKYNGTGSLVKSGNIFDYIVTNNPSPKLHDEVIKFEYKNSQGNTIKDELDNSSNIVFESDLQLRCGYNSLSNRIENTGVLPKHFHIFNASMDNIVLDVNRNKPYKWIGTNVTNEYLIDDRITLGQNQTHEHVFDDPGCNNNSSIDACTPPPCTTCTDNVNRYNWQDKLFSLMLSNIVVPAVYQTCHQCEIFNAYYYSQFHPNSDSLYPYLIPALDSALRIGILEPDTKSTIANMLFRLHKHLKLPTDANTYLDYLLEHLSKNQIDSLIIELERLKMHIDFEVDPHSQEYVELLNIYMSAPLYMKNDSAGGGGINPKITLGQNQEVAEELSIYPNPFEESTSITYFLQEDSNIELKLFDLLGNEVMVIDQGFVKKGLKKYIIDGESLFSGSYFVILKKDNSIISKKVLYLK